MKKASQIYYGGDIITMDSRASKVEAIAVKDDIILALGTKEEVLSFKDDNTIMTDLKGKTMLPGFIDPHGHFAWSGNMFAYFINLCPTPIGNTDDIAEMKRKIAERAKNTKKGEWIMAYGYDDTILKEKRHPLAHEIDEVSPDNPVLLSHVSGHICVANSYAMKLANITKDTPNPFGGVYRRYEDGSPNGVCEEPAAMTPIRKLIPELDDEKWLHALDVASKAYTAKGVTSAQDGLTYQVFYDALKNAHEKKVLKLRIQMLPSPTLMDVKIFNTQASGTQLTEDKMLSLGALKLLADGSLQCYTGFLSNPYHEVIYDLPDAEKWRGYPLASHEELAETVLKYHKEGWQLAIHGNGDDAIQNIIDAIENANKVYPRANARHIIIHCQTVREDQLDRIQRLGIIPAFFVVHTYYWGDRHRDIFLGEDRARRINPCRSAMDRDLKFTNHNDTFVTPIDPLLSVWSAANRITSSGKVLGKEQCVPVIDALRAVTSHAAHQAFEEKIKGSLEVGKLADMVILAENPLEIDPVKIKDIKIETTIVGNSVVYGSLPS